MQTTRVVDPTNTLWRRIGAFAIDMGIEFVVSLVLFAVLRGTVGQLVAWLVAIAINVGNLVILQGVSGASVGKKLVGLAVVNENGGICGIGKATVRWLGLIIDMFPYCLPVVGFITFFSDKNSQRVGDRFANTYVVDKSFVGSPPFAMAFPADPDQEPYQLKTMSAYQSGPVNAPTTPAPGTVDEPPPAAPESFEASPTKRGNEPVWDPDRQAYVRWDARRNCWLTFDETTKEWSPTE